MIAKVAGGMVTASGAMEMPGAEVRSATRVGGGLADGEDRLGLAQVGGDAEPAPVDEQPPGVLVVVDAHQVEARVGQFRAGSAQRQQGAVPGEHRPVRLAGGLVPVELGAQKRLLILRVGDVGLSPAVMSEL